MRSQVSVLTEVAPRACRKGSARLAEHRVAAAMEQECATLRAMLRSCIFHESDEIVPRSCRTAHGERTRAVRIARARGEGRRCSGGTRLIETRRGCDAPEHSLHPTHLQPLLQIEDLPCRALHRTPRTHFHLGSLKDVLAAAGRDSTLPGASITPSAPPLPDLAAQVAEALAAAAVSQHRLWQVHLLPMRAGSERCAQAA